MTKRNKNVFLLLNLWSEFINKYKCTHFLNNEKKNHRRNSKVIYFKLLFQQCFSTQYNIWLTFLLLLLCLKPITNTSYCQKNDNNRCCHCFRKLSKRHKNIKYVHSPIYDRHKDAGPIDFAVRWTCCQFNKNFLNVSGCNQWRLMVCEKDININAAFLIEP